MAPSTHIEVPPEPKVKKEQPAETLVLEPRKAVSAPPPGASKWRAPEEGSFKASMLEYNQFKSSSRLIDTLISLSINFVILIIPLFAGLYFTDTLDLKQFASTFLVAPPPPPPPPPAPTVVVRAAAPRRVFENAGKLIAPRAIPKEIQMIKEAPLPPDMEGVGVAGGVPGGVAGGTMGGVIGGVIGGVTSAGPLAPKREGPRAPVRVGGRVKEPRLISRVDPVYPSLARQTHMQGSVVIDAIIDEHGDVVEMKVVSGPPLLIQAAMDAVRRWKYQPTYLNEEPVPVQLNVTVTFRLND
ncbi:MAG TPA: energy transducer TonB [Candidatus Sulfotelmatobacter sp.]|nr:energy transducer TonB [Candidatus Sulfotelmatobacter sp.]